jgi:hypothetical protein
MELIIAKNDNIKNFLEFYKKQYLNHDLKRDTLSGMLKNILFGRSVLNKSVDIEPVMVVNNEEIIMAALLAHAERMPEYLQISFFESEGYNMEAFNLILERAVEKAREKKAFKLTGSLNIHVNYGLGFLASGFDTRQSFGSPYNPDFYNDYFEKSGFQTIHMVSYKKDMVNSPSLISEEVREKLKRTYTVREANFPPQFVSFVRTHPIVGIACIFFLSCANIGLVFHPCHIIFCRPMVVTSGVNFLIQFYEFAG